MTLGIPDRNTFATLPNITIPTTWKFVIQEHIAKRAGKHFDLRLGDPSTGYGYSWAGKRIPEVGNKELFVEQPTHTVDYFSFEGNIKSGYGAGDVRTHIIADAEILRSENDKITFQIYNLSTPQKFTLVRLDGKNWLLINHSLNLSQKAALDTYLRPKYKELKSLKDIKETDFVTPKIDGAYALMLLPRNKQPTVWSRRDSKRTGMPIEYTAKIPNLLGNIAPDDISNTVLQTEIFAADKKQEIPNRILSGLLNSNVWKSREAQEALKTPLRIAATNVFKYKGKDVSNLPIEQRYEIIKEISKKYPIIYNPLTLEKKINFPEGKVVWRNGMPYKIKHRPDFDVFVRNIFPDKTGKMAGGFEYSLSPNGKTLGRVGTGWDHDEKTKMLQTPQDYIGRLATIYAQEQLPSGAYRSPSFKTWRVDY